jgi:hypothetical protein
LLVIPPDPEPDAQPEFRHCGIVCCPCFGCDAIIGPEFQDELLEIWRLEAAHGCASRAEHNPRTPDEFSSNTTSNMFGVGCEKSLILLDNFR